ncbi:MAG: hypothetical protein U0230_03280 [Polyangiales bacterium]
MTESLLERLKSALERPLVQVGSTDVYRWVQPWDGKVSDVYLRCIGERCVSTTIAGDTECAVRVLQSIDESLLDMVSAANPLARVGADRGHVPHGLETLALFHPAVAKAGFEKSASFITPAMYRVVPSYRCEWKDEPPQDMGLRLRSIVPGARLDRAPVPALSRRYNHVRSGLGTKGKKLWLETLEKTKQDVAKLEQEQGACEVENFENQRAMIRFEEHFTVTQGKETWTPKPGTVLEWLEVFCTKGAKAAAEARQTDAG